MILISRPLGSRSLPKFIPASGRTPDVTSPGSIGVEPASPSADGGLLEPQATQNKIATAPNKRGMLLIVPPGRCAGLGSMR